MDCNHQQHTMVQVLLNLQARNPHLPIDQTHQLWAHWGTSTTQVHACCILCTFHPCFMPYALAALAKIILNPGALILLLLLLLLNWVRATPDAILS